MTAVLTRPLRWLGTGYLAYLVICLLVLMPAMNILAPRLVQEHLNRELRSELLLFNPFTLAFQARKLSLHEPDGHQPLAFRLFEVNLSLSSLWQEGIVLDAVLLDELDLHVLRYDNGDFHFADLIEGASRETPPEPQSATELPGITVHTLAIDAHTLRFTDRTRPGPYTTVQRDLSLRKRNLTTLPDRAGNGDLELTSDGGGRLTWKGSVNVADGSSSGRIVLDAIDLTPLWRYEKEKLDFAVHSARFAGQFDYAASWSGDVQFTLRDSRVRLYDWDIMPVDVESVPNTRVALGDLQLTGIAFDLLAQTVAIDALAISGVEVAGYDEEGAPSLLLLAGDAAAENPDVDAADPAPDDGWTVSLARLNLGDSRVDWRTEFLAPEVLSVTPIELQAQDIRWPAEAETPYSLTLSMNGTSNLRIDGSLNLQSGRGNVDTRLENFVLAWLNPVVNEQARTDISRGTLTLSSAVVLEEFMPQTVVAELSVDDFATQLHDSAEEAFTLQQLKVSDATVDITEQSVIIGELLLQRPTGSLHIREDGTINVNGVVRERPEAPETEEAPWRVVLSKLTLRDGRLDFADASLPLPFETLIDSINADATDIDTAARSSLQLTLKGSVDGYAPVLIEGSGRPLATIPDGKLRLNFRGVDIAAMSPYSGTYAGYTIDSGTLSLDLNYALEGVKIQGDNRIVISQMKLGEPVESELAIDVPLKLGLALLTDSNGVIDLGVPVSGNVDDPQFSLGGVIGKAIANVIVKAVTAPFKLLAGLVGSEDDLENIAFASGAATLDAKGQRTLATLAEALTQRPQLQLRVVGGTDLTADRQVLAENALRNELLAAGLEPSSLDNRDEAFAAAVGERFAALPGSSSGEGNDEEAPVPTLDEQWQALVDAEPVTEDDLRQLGTARAAEAKRELVNVGGIDAERIAIAYDLALQIAGVKMTVDG